MMRMKGDIKKDRNKIPQEMSLLEPKIEYMNKMMKLPLKAQKRALECLVPKTKLNQTQMIFNIRT